MLRGKPDGNFIVLGAKSGDALWKFPTGFGADAPSVAIRWTGQYYLAIVTGGNSIQGSAFGDAV